MTKCLVAIKGERWSPMTAGPVWGEKTLPYGIIQPGTSNNFTDMKMTWFFPGTGVLAAHMCRFGLLCVCKDIQEAPFWDCFVSIHASSRSDQRSRWRIATTTPPGRGLGSRLSLVAKRPQVALEGGNHDPAGTRIYHWALPGAWYSPSTETAYRQKLSSTMSSMATFFLTRP